VVSSADEDCEKHSFEVVPWAERFAGGFAGRDPRASLVGQRAKVYPRNTLLAWACDWAIYAAFCAERGFTTVPASPETIAAFIEACGEQLKKPATIRRYLSTIALAHRVAKFPIPVSKSRCGSR
jgi:hypothetical protein